MRDPPPIPGNGGISEAHHLRFGDDIPKTELDPKRAIGPNRDPALDHGLCIDYPPVAKTRQRVHGRICPDKRPSVDGAKESGAQQIRFNDFRQIPAEAFFPWVRALKVRHGDRQRLDNAARDIDPKLRPGRAPRPLSPTERNQ